MAIIANPRKQFQFSVEINGFNAFLAQEVDLPLPEINAVAHGDTNHDVKTAGRVSLDDLVIRKLIPAPGSDVWAWAWLNTAQDMVAGGGALPDSVKSVVVVRELDSTGTVALNSYVYSGAWVRRIEHSGFSRTGDDNLIETVTFSVDQVRKI